MKRLGFTLIELLVVIMILAILASIVLFALASVQEDARAMKTRATIQKLDALIMQKYESYKTRRVPVNVALVADYYKKRPATDKRSILLSAKDVEAVTYARLSVLRDLMRLEMPDGISDVTDAPATEWLDSSNNLQTMPIPSASRAIKAKVPSGGISSNVSAKMLYLTVVYGLGDPDVLEQFAPNEIAADADGLKYFVDGWGTPIQWLRWAPAFRSPLQPSKDGNDPFDTLNVCEGTSIKSTAEDTFVLTPLIYSWGPDKQSGITADGKGSAAIRYKDYNNDPFHADVSDFVGKADGSASLDNITNHSQE
jgi:prepilin-type N-terminal cleavage/methylation domain-containing protein